jgi:capsular exopolysaccharide synthesis family protein
VDFKNLMRVARRRWKTIAAMLAIALCVSAVLSFTTTRQYESKAKIYISADSSSATGSDIGANFYLSAQVKSYAQLANHQELMQRVIEELHLKMTPGQLAGKVTAVVQPETLIIEDIVHDEDPELAQQIAQVHAEQMVIYLKDLETPEGDDHPQIKATITDPATYNDNPVAPKTTMNLAIAAVLGLLLGSALALVRELLDNTIHSVEEMESVIDAPVMASIGIDPELDSKPLLTDLRGFSPRGEAFRMLRTNLQFLDLDSDPKSLVITSAVAGEGKTTTSTNLAVALAQAGRRVLVVDGDLRRPRVAGILGLESKIGLTTVLVGRTKLEDSIQRHEESGVYFLACGPTPPNPSEILQSKATHDLLRKLRDMFDAVIIDAPPLLPVADAAILATVADGAIIVARHGKTHKDQLKAATQRLNNVGGKLFGVVVNMIPKRYQNSYYYYYYEEAEAPGARKKAKAE